MKNTWTIKAIRENRKRAQMAESVSLPIAQFNDLLDLAEIAADPDVEELLSHVEFALSMADNVSPHGRDCRRLSERVYDLRGRLPEIDEERL